jgi:hypothetical protein
MTVSYTVLEENGKWLGEFTSDLNPEETILIGVNGRIAIRSYGYTTEIWPGFADEHDPFYGDAGESEDESEE